MNEEKNKGGRPPIHTDPEVVENLVQSYFDSIITEEGYKRPPTVTGLTLHLGFAHKDTLYEYAKKPEFTDSIKRGLTQIEEYHEIQAAHGDKCTGNIFVLKNFGWKDKIETTIEGGDKPLNVIDYSKLDDETLHKLLNATKG